MVEKLFIQWMKEYNVGDIIKISKFIGYVSFCEIVNPDSAWDVYYTISWFTGPCKYQETFLSHKELLMRNAIVLS